MIKKDLTKNIGNTQNIKEFHIYKYNIKHMMIKK